MKKMMVFVIFCVSSCQGSNTVEQRDDIHDGSFLDRDGSEDLSPDFSFLPDSSKVCVPFVPPSVKKEDCKEGISCVKVADKCGRQVESCVCQTLSYLVLPKEAPFKSGPRKDHFLVMDRPTKIAKNVQELLRFLSSARSGDRIEIDDGVYDIGEIEIQDSNVQIFAKNPGSVVFTNTSKMTLKGDHVTIEGIQFREGDGDISYASPAIVVEGNNIHISHCAFEKWGIHQWENNNTDWALAINIDVYAENTEISDCKFSELYGMSILKAQLFESDFSGGKGLWVHHNLWVDNPYREGLGYAGEALHSGTAWTVSQGVPGKGDYDNDQGVVFEYNHLLRHYAESEIISIKSSGSIIRYNTVEDCKTSGFVIRMGNENLIYANWMTKLSGAGVRISGERNLVAFNYFEGHGIREGWGTIDLHSEVLFSPSTRPGLYNSYWAANDTRVHRNFVVGAPTFLSLIDVPNETVVSSPIRGVYSENFFLGTEGAFFDNTGKMNLVSFSQKNELKDNSKYVFSEDRWMPSKRSTFDPISPLEIDSTRLFSENETKLLPPTWWQALFVFE